MTEDQLITLKNAVSDELEERCIENGMSVCGWGCKLASDEPLVWVYAKPGYADPSPTARIAISLHGTRNRISTEVAKRVTEAKALLSEAALTKPKAIKAWPLQSVGG